MQCNRGFIDTSTTPRSAKNRLDAGTSKERSKTDKNRVVTLPFGAEKTTKPKVSKKRNITENRKKVTKSEQHSLV